MYDLVILAVAATLNLSGLANVHAGTRPPCAAGATAQAAATASSHAVCAVDPATIRPE